MTTREELVTTEQFEAYIARPENAERRFELIDGEIVEKTMPTRQHGRIAGLFSTWFNLFFMEHPDIVANVAVEARHRPTGDEHNDRIPDVSVVFGDKPLLERGVEDYIPDICVEIQSPDDSLTELREKCLFYIKHGAKYALVVKTAKPGIEVFTQEEVITLSLDDSLAFAELLPGFSVPVARFFPPAE